MQSRDSIRSALPKVIWAVPVVLIAAAVLRPFFAGSAAPAKPEETVYRAFECARNGDVDGYLDCFSGELRKQLEKSVKDAGNDRFANQLKARAKQVAGLAVTRNAAVAPGAKSARLQVEIVFPDRNEVQEYTLAAAWGRGWQIQDMGVSKTVTMPIPYGSPVIPEQSGSGNGTAPRDSSSP